MPPRPLPATASVHAAALAVMPAVFVLLWSTGFIGARFVLPHSEPLTFMTLRFAITTVVFLPIVWLSGARWPAIACTGATPRRRSGPTRAGWATSPASPSRTW